MPLLPPPSVSKARSLGLEPRTLSFIPPLPLVAHSSERQVWVRQVWVRVSLEE